MDSSTSLAPVNLIRTLINLGKADEAAATSAETRRRLGSITVLETMDGAVFYARGRPDSAAAVFRHARTSRSPRTRALAVRSLAGLAVRQGRLADGVRLLSESRAEDEQRGAPVSPIADSITVSLLESWFDTQPGRAVQRLDALLARLPLRSLPVDDRDYFRIASVYALAGRPDRARAVLTQYESEVKDTTLRRWFEPEMHRAMGEIALAERRPRDAIAEFRRGDRRPDGPADDCPICVYMSLGRAFDQAQMPDSAIAELERYVTTPWWRREGLRTDGLFLAAAYKRLGELYDGKGDRPHAVAFYNKFIDLWRNADPELQARTRDVRERLVRLGDAERR